MEKERERERDARVSISIGYNYLEQPDEIHFRDWRLSIEAYRGAVPNAAAFYSLTSR